MSVTLPTLDEIRLLPRWGQVLLAIKIAEYTTPLLKEYWPKASSEHIRATSKAIELAKEHCTKGKGCSTRFAHHKDINKIGTDKLASYCSAIAHSAVLASQGAITLADIKIDYDRVATNTLVTYPVMDTIKCVQLINRDDINTLIVKDFETIKRIATEQNIDDYTLIDYSILDTIK